MFRGFYSKSRDPSEIFSTFVQLQNIFKYMCYRVLNCCDQIRFSSVDCWSPYKSTADQSHLPGPGHLVVKLIIRPGDFAEDC